MKTQSNAQFLECLSWVKTGLLRPTAARSALGGEADVISAKADIGGGMSEAGVNPDVSRPWLELRFLAEERTPKYSVLTPTFP